MTFRDTDDMNIDSVIKSTVESVAENTTDWAVAPIFWSAIFGGLGGILYRTVNIIDNTVGYKTDTYINFGKFPAKLDDVLSFIPARIAALLMKMNVSYLHLDSRNASQVYKKTEENPLVLIQRKLSRCVQVHWVYSLAVMSITADSL